MKKFLGSLVLVAVCSVTSVFADDAQVLPALVGRINIANTYGMVNGAYDKDGKYTAYEANQNKAQFYNLGFALEFGLTDWITAAVQWAPGINLWSTVDYDMSKFSGLTTGNSSTININDTSDIFAGAKFQIIGKKAPVAMDMIRFAIAPGVLIPTPGPNADTQFENLNSGKPYTNASANHALGFGGRIYFDVVPSEMFFFNLYAEYIYLSEVTIKKANVGAPALGSPNTISETKYNYGYSLTLEAEPHVDLDLSPDTSLGIGLPVSYEMSPNVIKNGVEQTNSASTTLTLKPGVSIFLKKAFVPLEFKLGYYMPVMATSSASVAVLVFQTKVYFAIR